jgi:hypothetical protein
LIFKIKIFRLSSGTYIRFLKWLFLSTSRKDWG